MRKKINLSLLHFILIPDLKSLSTGRAFGIRVCFGIAGIPFEDERVAFEDWGKNKGDRKRFPLGTMPVLTLASGQTVVQSGGILRYAAKLAKLYPEDPLQELLVDEILDTMFEAGGNMPHGTDEEAKKKNREAYLAGKCNFYFSYLAEKLEANGGAHFVGNTLTVADIAVYGFIKGFRTGIFDFVPTTYDSQWPAIQTFLDAMEADPVFAPYKI